MANRYWVGGAGTWNTSSTTRWSASSGGASGASVPTAADSVFFDQAGTYTVTMTGALTCLDLTVSAGTVTFATGTTPTLAVSGSWSTTASTVWSSTGTITFNATTSKTVNTNGITLNCNVTFSGAGGTWTLQSDFVAGTTRTVTLTNGTLALSTFTLTTGLFNSSNSNTRTLDFGTGKIALNTSSSFTVFTVSTSTNFAVSGTPLIECSGGGTNVTKTINTGTSTEAQAISFSLLDTGGTNVSYDIVGNVTNPVVKNLILNGSQSIGSSSGSTLFIYGSFTHSTASGTTTIGSSITLISFIATSGSYTVTPSAITYSKSFTFGVASTTASWTLGANLTVGPNTSSASYETITLTGGTFSLSSYTVTTGAFVSNNSNTRTLNFGTGKIVSNYSDVSNGLTIWNTSTVTGLTVSGTPLFECGGGGGTLAGMTKTITLGALSQANSISVSLLETTGTASQKTYAITGTLKNLTVNGIQTVSSTTIYGNFVYNNTNGTSVFSTTLTFATASGTQTITSNGLTVDANFTINGTGGSVQLQDNLTIGVSRQLTFTSGTFDFNNKTYSGGGITILTPGATIANTGGTSVSLTSTITHTSGAFSLPCNVTTTSAYTFTAGTLTLGTSTLSVLNFAGQGNSVKTIAYGTGQLALTGNNTTILNLVNATNLSSTGTVYINSTYTGATGTKGISTTNLTEAQISGYSVSTSGTSGIVLSPVATDTVDLIGSFNDVNLTGFSGTLSNSTRTIYGNLIIPASGGTYTAGVNVTSFRATSGVKTITTNGRTIDFALNFNGVGGTWQLQDALTMGSTRTLTHTNGTLDLNGKTLTVGTSYTTAAGTKNLTFNGGTLVCPDVTATAFNNAAPTGYTTTAGTGTGKISMTGATAKTFVGGGSTFNCTLSNDGAGALTIAGNNTFTTIANSVQPTTFRFTGGTTTTVTNWSVNGTSGNLVIIASDVTIGGTHTLSKATGTVSSDYLNITNSIATGGAAWYAGANSTNGGGNTGWIFSAPGPGTSTPSFLLMFN
jgi:hypothetical protein